MNTPQRVDVERFDCTNGGANWCNGCYTMELHDDGDYVLYDDYAALQQQLAEERELRMAVEKSWHHELARAEAAERAREEAHGLLRDVIAWRRTVPIDETPNRKDGGIFGRIAAFLAANGTAMGPTHSAGGE